MKKIIFLFLLSMPLLIMAQSTTPYLTRQLSADNIKSVEAQTSGGSISVTAVPAGEARLEVYIKGNNNKELSNEEIKERLSEKYTLDISVSSNKLSAIAK